MNFIDTHAHVNLKAFSSDAKEVLARCFENGVGVVNVGTDLSTSRRAVELVDTLVSALSVSQGLDISPKGGEQYGASPMWAVVGLHPSHTYDNPYLDENESASSIGREVFDYEEYKELASHPRVVGIGECGLDYYRLDGRETPLGGFPAMATPSGRSSASGMNPPGLGHIDNIKFQQKQAFELQINLAQELNKALVIHCRPSQGSNDAYEDVLEILELKTENLKLKTLPFEVHSFTGNWEIAEKFLQLGGYLGFNGILTFDKSGVLAEVVKNAPLDRLLLESDAPYLAPAPNRGKRNEPQAVKVVAQKIAEIKNISVEEVAEQTTKNAKEFFRIL